ncbi:hypothetical protein AtubIFM56815_005108 [Aspergillus tubingensis]|uniref:glutathione transferase n=1 Tax=Aspergillus tubingensis TaxID=5068 RepID=A0A9W6AI12_ASPTU|nr:hypothetical protein AtubIFM56815_005108 [Aspergillus tubingensis]
MALDMAEKMVCIAAGMPSTSGMPVIVEPSKAGSRREIYMSFSTIDYGNFNRPGHFLSNETLAFPCKMPLTPKVYGSVSSTCTQRVLIVLEELEIDYELIPINMRAGEHKGPSYLSKHNPFGYIPAYQDKDVKIFESRAICHYLAAKNGGHLVPPSNPLQVAEFQQTASVEYSYFDPPMKQLAYESLFKRVNSMMGHGEPDTSLVSLYKDQIRKCLDYYEGILEKQDYLGGTV